MSERRYQQSQETVSRCFDDELVIVHLHSGDIFRLNRTGQSMWQQCDQARTLAEILSGMPERALTDAATLLRDAEALLAELVKNRLIRVVE